MKDFIKYFTGLKRNFGFCNINNGYKDPDTGKLKFNPGDYGWSGKLITEEDYNQHLNGTKSIGIQPCDDDGLARFGAIDIDPKVYKNLDIKFYLDTIQQKQLPLIPIKSKSGGLHLYVFTKELVKAKVIKDFLEQVLFLRVALDPSGQEMTLDLFLEVVEMNLMTSTKLKEISDNIIKIELTGGAEEFKDGPPCLEILSKEMDDGRDRFLYNYMVFAKKKYADDWAKKVLQAGRNYFEFNETWTDDYIKKKIKNWEKDTKGHTCNDQLLAPVCVKSECVKRRFGVISDKKIDWPMMTNLIKVDFKPDPEYYFTVENKTGESVVVHAKNVTQLRDQKELGSLIMAQVNVLPPPIKPLDFHALINALLDTVDTVQPAPGTRPMEILKKHLKEYINGTQAKTYASFESGNVLKDEVYAYFVYDEFYNELKENGWRKDSSRTSHMIQKMFDTKDDSLPQPEFGKKKRFPGKHKKTGKPYPGVNGCVAVPLYLFDKEEEDIEETADFTEEEIV